jgi:hypothetical protein
MPQLKTIYLNFNSEDMRALICVRIAHRLAEKLKRLKIDVLILDTSDNRLLCSGVPISDKQFTGACDSSSPPVDSGCVMSVKAVDVDGNAIYARRIRTIDDYSDFRKFLFQCYCLDDVYDQLSFAYLKCDGEAGNLLSTKEPWKEIFNVDEIENYDDVENRHALFLHISPRNLKDILYLRGSYPEVIFIGIPTGNIIDSFLNQSDASVDFHRLIESIDILLTSAKLDEDIYSIFHPTVINVGQPFCVSRFSSYVGLEKYPNIGLSIAPGVSKNVVEIGRRLINDVTCSFPSMNGVVLEYVYGDEPARALDVQGMLYVRNTDEKWHIISLARCRCVLNLNYMPDVDILPFVCSYFGIPCIGPKCQEWQNALWPDVSYEAFDFAGAKCHLEKTLANPEFEKTIILKSQNTLRSVVDQDYKMKFFSSISRRLMTT